MIITAVERLPRRRARVRVYVDGEPALELAKEIATKRALRPGLEVTQSQIDALLAEDARRSATTTVASMLARRPRSEQEVRRRLRQRKTPPELIDETIEKFREMKLIDDPEFARSWAESRDRTSPRGRRLIAAELRALGVDVDAAREASGDIDEEDAAYRYASRRVRALASLDYGTFRARLGGQLQRRGFAWSIIAATVDRCWRDLGNEEGAEG
jgi:regulatory protein